MCHQIQALVNCQEKQTPEQKAFCQLRCVCEMQLVKTHLITFAAIVMEEAVSQTYRTQTQITTPVLGMSPWDLCFSFMLLLDNTEVYVSICLNKGVRKDYLVLRMPKKR